jgi:hypothetical protein
MTDRRTIEARTIRDLAELQAFLDDCLAAVDAPADCINLGTPVDLRLVEITLTDGSKVYDIEPSRW